MVLARPAVPMCPMETRRTVVPAGATMEIVAVRAPGGAGPPTGADAARLGLRGRGARKRVVAAKQHRCL